MFIETQQRNFMLLIEFIGFLIGFFLLILEDSQVLNNFFSTDYGISTLFRQTGPEDSHISSEEIESLSRKRLMGDCEN